MTAPKSTSRHRRNAACHLLARRLGRLSPAARADRADARLLLRAAARPFGLNTVGVDARFGVDLQHHWTVCAGRYALYAEIPVGAAGRCAASPFFTRAFGRRRGWLVFSQLLLIGSILLLALTDPARSPLYVALGALLVAAMSSTQDIVVDAFRVESLPESEQAAGMRRRRGLSDRLADIDGRRAVPGERVRNTVLGRHAAWMWGYIAMAALVLIGTVTALVATEPVSLFARKPRRATRARSRASCMLLSAHSPNSWLGNTPG